MVSPRLYQIRNSAASPYSLSGSPQAPKTLWRSLRYSARPLRFWILLVFFSEVVIRERKMSNKSYTLYRMQVQIYTNFSKYDASKAKKVVYMAERCL